MLWPLWCGGGRHSPTSNPNTIASAVRESGPLLPLAPLPPHPIWRCRGGTVFSHEPPAGSGAKPSCVGGALPSSPSDPTSHHTIISQLLTPTPPRPRNSTHTHTHTHRRRPAIIMSDAPAAAAAPGNSTAGKVASELIISERWDKCLERCVARLFVIDHWIACIYRWTDLCLSIAFGRGCIMCVPTVQSWV